MKIHADDEAFLTSKMSDVSVALMLNWSLARVERARAWLAENPSTTAPAPSPAETWLIEEAAPPADPNLIGKALPAHEALDPAGWIGAPAQCKDIASALPAEAQIDLEEAIAAKVGPHGAPAGLSPPGLAAWLVDNSTLEFAEIAATAGVPLGQVQAIADDEPWPPEPKKTAVRAPKPPKVQSQPPTPKPPPAPRNPAVASTQSEIPPRVVRWAGFFIDARWRIGDVAGLFDCNPADLAAALGR